MLSFCLQCRWSWCAGAAAVVAVGAAAAPEAAAQVIDWDFFKAIGYTQTSNDAQPMTADAFVVDSFICMTTSADATAVTLDGVLDYVRADDNAAEFDYFESFQSLAAMNAAFPGGTVHTITLSGGTLGTVEQSFTIPTDMFPTSAPYLTGDAFDRLQGMDPLSALTLSMNTAGSAGAVVFSFELSRMTPMGGDEVVYEEVILDPNASSFEIPAGVLEVGAEYELLIGFANRTTIDADPSGFNAAGVFVHGAFTRVAFSTIPTPGTATLLGLAVTVAFGRRWRGERA